MGRRSWLLVFALLSFGAPALADDAAVVAAYHRLTSQEVEARPATPPPADALPRIDVSAKVRSASFGHTTMLLVEGDHYFVEYGRSTNRPKRLYGPFPAGTRPTQQTR
jgi:hypothetical protein